MSETSRAMASGNAKNNNVNNANNVNHSTNTTTGSMHREGQEEAIVDKLQSVMAALRRERDDLHRKKALAQERLALFLEEKEALEKTHANALIKLEELKKSGNEDAIQEVVGLEQEVIRLNKEVRLLVKDGKVGGRLTVSSDRLFSILAIVHSLSLCGLQVQFQHAELVAKRNKVQDMRKSHEEEQQKRTAIIQGLHEKERRRRLMMQKQTSSVILSSESALRKLNEELEHEYDTEVLWNRNIPRWMKLSADSLNAEADEIHRENESLSKVLMGYKKRIDAAVGMQQ